MRVILIALATFLVCATAEAEKKVVCYFGSWAIYRPGNGKFEISDFDSTLCTHLMYAFVGINPNGDVVILDANADLPPPEGNQDGFNKFNKLREKNPNVKTIISMGGWNQGSVNYSIVVGQEETRRKLVENVVVFVKKHGFHGFDLDWEYPNQRGGKEADKKNFVLLLKELRERFDKEGLILSVALGAGLSTASQSYIIPEISKYVHFINLMTYEFHSAADGVTGMNAPLYARTDEIGANRSLNVDAAVSYWLSEGALAEQIILGIPLYGKTFTLDRAGKNKVGAPASKPGKAGPYTQEAGTLGYNEICEMQQNEGDWNDHFDKEQRVPYMVKGDQWVSYDNVKSIKEKVEFINKVGFGGAMVWSIETDDFRGICGGKYPLLTTINRVLYEEN